MQYSSEVPANTFDICSHSLENVKTVSINVPKQLRKTVIKMGGGGGIYMCYCKGVHNVCSPPTFLWACFMGLQSCLKTWHGGLWEVLLDWASALMLGPLSCPVLTNWADKVFLELHHILKLAPACLPSGSGSGRLPVHCQREVHCSLQI